MSSETLLPSAPITRATRFIMLAGGLTVMIALSALTPVLPQIETALAVTANDKLLVKMLVPIIGVTMVIGAPLMGAAIDRFSIRKLLIAASLLYAVSGTAGLYLDSLYALLVSRLFVGLSAAGLATMAMTLINTRLEGNERARWMGYHISTAMFGSLLVHPTIGFLGELGWRWPFLIYALGLVLAVVAIIGMREEVPLAHSEALANKAAGAQRAPRDANPLRWFPLWFLPLALVMGTVTYLPNVYMPFMVREIGVTSPAIIAAVMLADAMIGASLSLLFGRSQRYLSSDATFAISFGCVGAGMLVVSLSHSLTGVVAGMLIFGLGLGWFVPNLMTSLSRRVSAARQGRAVGIVKAAHYVAAPLGVLAMEPISRAAGPAGVMLAGSVLSLCAAGVFVLMLTRGKRAAPMIADEPLAAE